MSGPVLHLVRTPIAPAALRAFAAYQGVLDDDLGYALHLALRRRFGAAAPQPWRLMPGRDGGPEMLLGYTQDPDALRAADPRAIARPEAPPDWEADWRDADDAESVSAESASAERALAALFPHPFEAKAMPRASTEGTAYGFSLRMRPVVRYGPRAAAARTAADRRGGEERDAFLAAIERRDLSGRTEESDPLHREPVYRTWLEQRLGNAAGLSAFRLVAHRRIRTVRSVPPDAASRRRPGFAGPETVVDGELTVADPAAFAALLARGVGRHGAFGFGMLLLLRPAGR